MNLRHHGGAFTDRGRDSFRRAGSDIADRKDA
jgi:hypothetical protein